MSRLRRKYGEGDTQSQDRKFSLNSFRRSPFIHRAIFLKETSTHSIRSSSLKIAAAVDMTSFQSLRPNSALAWPASPMTPVSEYLVKSRSGSSQSTSRERPEGILSSWTVSGRRCRAIEVVKLSACPPGTFGSATRAAYCAASNATDSANQVSKSTGKCGPCCSVHPVGKIAKHPASIRDLISIYV